MSFMLIGGAAGMAAVGAGVGSYGHDNWGWSRDAIWQGALLGGGAGMAAGGMMGGSAAGAAGGAGGASGAGGLGAAATQLSSGGTMAAMTSPYALAPSAVSGAAGATGMGLADAMMLGSAGLGLAGAFSSQGSSFQDKIELSPEGEALREEYFGAAKERFAKAKRGDVSDRAFGDISKLKRAETGRQRATSKAIRGTLARAGNIPKERRGGGVVGGGLVKAEVADMGERMEGLFAPTSTLNNYRKEELVNSARQLQNISNLDNQTAVFSYGSSLARWGANQQLASERGAAIGNAAAMVGGMQLNRAYLNQMAIA